MTEISHAGSPLLWGCFLALVLGVLIVDFCFLGGGRSHKVNVKEAAIWSVVWVGLALGFNLAFWWYLGSTQGAEIADQKALEFLTGYLIEKSLSVDNVFIFLLIFTAFKVPPEYQRRVLVYGVLGAVAMRIVMIFLGSWVVEEFHWVLYLFGAFLLVTGIRMWVAAETEPDLEQNPLLKFARKYLRITHENHGEAFWVRQKGLIYFTPLFLVLLLVEVSDLIFAVDSIPAIFAITTDPFIVATSNIFAILGLRALYFLLADMADRFHLLKYGLALVLSFIGFKMLIMHWFHIPTLLSLGVVITLIGGSVLASFWQAKKAEPR